MKRVVLSESELKNIISESVKLILKEKWEENYNAAMDKYDYENNKAEYDSKKWYQKIAAMLSGKKPQDPNPNQTLQALLDGYVEAFNKEHGIGKRSDYGNGETFHSRMKYQSDNKQPVLTATYNSGDGNIQQSRKAFRNDGSKEEWGIGYPYSEMGVTGDEAPSSAHSDAKWEYSKFKRNQDEISNVIRNRNNRKGGK